MFSRVLIFAVIGFVVLLSGPSDIFAKDPPAPKKMTVASVDSRITSVRSVLKRLLGELAEAKKQSDMHRVNCLQLKINLVKGLLKASEKANLVFLDATYASDAKTADSYGNKIREYGENVDEISQTIDECTKTNTAEGSALVYIRPEEPAYSPSESNPWGGKDGMGGVEGYPVVPPASPFR